MQPAAKLVALLRQHSPVDEHAVALHAVEDFRHRQLDVAVEGRESGIFLESRRQRLMHAQGDVGILGSIGGGVLDIYLGEGNAVRALAGDVVVADRLQPEVTCGERTEVVRLVGFQYVGLQQRVVDDAGQCDAVIGEDVAVVLEVLADLFVRCRLEPGFESGEGGVERQLLTAHRRSCAPAAGRQPDRIRCKRKGRPVGPAAGRGRWFRCRVKRVRRQSRRASQSASCTSVRRHA